MFSLQRIQTKRRRRSGRGVLISPCSIRSTIRSTFLSTGLLVDLCFLCLASCHEGNLLLATVAARQTVHLEDTRNVLASRATVSRVDLLFGLQRARSCCSPARAVANPRMYIWMRCNENTQYISWRVLRETWSDRISFCLFFRVTGARTFRVQVDMTRRHGKPCSINWTLRFRSSPVWTKNDFDSMKTVTFVPHMLNSRVARRFTCLSV